MSPAKITAGVVLSFAWLSAQEVSQSGLRLQAARPLIAQAERAPQVMVATVNEHATEAALEILRRGGNAIDAAVAIAFVLGVVHPEAGNLGGSGYLMARTADGKVTVFDYGGDSPAATKPEMFANPREKSVGYKSISIPGTPAGMGLAHARLGKLSWKQCLEPARRLADKGFPASQRMELILRLQVPVMKTFPETAKVFLHGADQPLKQGELVVQKDLAQTLKRMQQKGWQEFYTGETGRRIAADMAAGGGVITLEDLARYKAVEAAPLEIQYRGFPVLVTPPSSSGGAALAAMLNTLDQFEMKLGMEGSSGARHLQIEAMRIGFAARNRWMRGTDPAEWLVSRGFAEEEAKKIDLTRATATATSTPAESESQDTTHFTVADAQGNIVTNTYTLSGFYGSQVIAKGTGVLLNNHMSAFPREALKPNRRYASTMTPTMILRRDRTPWAAFGTPGGATIPSTLMQIVMNLVDFKMTLRDAIEFPRLHFGGAGNVDAEPAALVFDVAERLLGMGHRLNPNLRSQGDVNAVVVEEGTGWKQGWADGRRGGVVKGY